MSIPARERAKCLIVESNMNQLPTTAQVKQGARQLFSVATDKAKVVSANVQRGDTSVKSAGFTTTGLFQRACCFVLFSRLGFLQFQLKHND